MSKTQTALIGFAVGDAMGLPLEFMDRETLMKNPATEMKQKEGLPLGMFSDDTSMTIATMDDLPVGTVISADTFDIKAGEIKKVRITLHDHNLSLGDYKASFLSY